MDICDKKNKIQDLLNDIYSEYNRMNESKIQSKCETDLDLRTMSSNIRSLETSTIEKDNRIKSLEKTVYDYEKIIESAPSVYKAENVAAALCFTILWMQNHNILSHSQILVKSIKIQ